MSYANDQQHVSVSAVKAAFLQTQSRLLSAPLQISPAYRSWLRSSSSSSSGGGDDVDNLSDKQLTSLQKRVNDRISQHAKAVFSSQSISHVAEQIETLYWNQVRAELRATDVDVDDDGDGGRAAVAVEQDAQLTDEEVVDGLPESLHDVLLVSDGDGDNEEEEEKRYTELRGRLVVLAKKRREAELRLRRYQRLHALLQAYAAANGPRRPEDDGYAETMRAELQRTSALLAQVDTEAMLTRVDAKSLSLPTRTTTTMTGHDRSAPLGRPFDHKLQKVMDLG